MFVRAHCPRSLQVLQQAYYFKNTKSDTFGANLFTGAFARQGATQFTTPIRRGCGRQNSSSLLGRV